MSKNQSNTVQHQTIPNLAI